MQLFQRLEEESEQRAREEEERELQEEQDSLRDAVESMSTTTSTVRSASTRERRRGSISISRFGGLGQPPSDAASTDSRAPSTRGSRSSSIILTKPTFYQLDTRLHQPTGSTDSFASDTTSDPSIDEVEEEHHVAQTHFIPAQSISKAISRRLSRARDLVPLSSPSSTGTLVIGVAVEANTVEHGDEAGFHTPQAVAATTTTTVYTGCTPGLRTQRSTPGLNERTNFFAKAKDITSKLRRKSVAALTPASR